jgi:hypothetical protein
MEKQPTNPLTLADLQAALTGLATKEDLNALATPEALSALTTNVTTIQETGNAIMETVAGTKEDVIEMQEDKKAMEGRLTTCLDRIEHLLLAKQEQRLNDLEGWM